MALGPERRPSASSLPWGREDLVPWFCGGQTVSSLYSGSGWQRGLLGNMFIRKRTAENSGCFQFDMCIFKRLPLSAFA